MKTVDIHQTIIFPTTAIDLYHCIMDARVHSSFTGSAAEIEDKENTDFTVFDGYAGGKNMVLERGKKIVQTWRANEEHWPAGHYSEVVFLFTDTPEGCKLDFFQTGIPAEVATAIAEGWHEYYWEPLRFYLER